MHNHIRKVFMLIFCLSLIPLNAICLSDYQKEWKQIAQFQNKGLPKSALKIAKDILKAAKKEKNSAQIVKAMLSQFYYLQEVEENSAIKIYQGLQTELKSSSYPLTPLLHSLTANLLWSYYQQNRWKFLNRTKTTIKKEDMQTWDLQTLVEEVQKHYALSLSTREKLKQTKVDIYDDVLNKNTQSRYLRPTLYDFLMHRAIDFYMHSEAGLSQPAQQFSINDSQFFSDNQNFATLKITTPDPDSFSYLALKYLQDLTLFHLRDPNPEALLDVTLKRLQFIYSKANLNNKTALYRKSLFNLISQYQMKPFIAEAYYALASLYNQLGEQYRPLASKRYKWLKKKAVLFCEKAISQYPQSLGANNCQYLIDTIKFRRLSLTMEKNNLPSEPFRGLVEYRNIKEIYFKIFSYDPKDRKTYNYYNKELLSYYLSQNPIANWSISVPDDSDYQIHKTEIKMPALAAGNYLLIASNTPDFDLSKNSIAYSQFTTTRVAFLQRQLPEGLEIKTLDRKTSHPLAGIKVVLWMQEYDNQSRKYFFKEYSSFTTKEDGSFLIPTSTMSSHSFYLEFHYQNEAFFWENSFYLGRYYENHPERTHTVFFTDRSIYRPGQTVYFKGIVYDSNYLAPEENKVLSARPITVTFFDVNNQKVNSLNLITNEFGTIQGSFTIPTGLLNGKMRITGYNGNAYISVEEYKRPQFEVKFEPIKKTYTLNEEVSVKGKALALAGYPIDNAKVKYTVNRLAYFPYRWLYYWYFPQPKPTEILTGFAKTDGEGNFTVNFQALPDLGYSKKSLPAFIYTVTADVTDLNGETQSTQTALHVGYTSLKLNLYISSEIDKQEKAPDLRIETTNLNNIAVPNQGRIKIDLLHPPKSFKRKRLWSEPDRKSFSEEEYEKLFPFDEYQSESDTKKWKVKKTVSSFEYDTKNETLKKLKDIADWEPGKYRILMESKDDKGQEVKQVAYFTLIDSSSKKLALPALGWIQNTPKTYQPGDTAKLLLGSTAKDVKVLYEIENRQKLLSRKFIELNEEQKLLSIPIEEQFRGNVTLRFMFVKHNQLISETRTLYVPWKNKDLKITFETFRDKLKPGQEESWRLRISGAARDKIAAELAGTLYDASLDSFLPHYWNLSAFPSFYPRWNFTTYGDFNTVSTRDAGRNYDQYHNYQTRSYDSLNFFGFYWRDYYRHRRYRSMKNSSLNGYTTGAEMEEGERDEEKVADISPKKASPSVAKNGKGKHKDSFDNLDQPSEPNPAMKKVAPLQVRSNFNETAFFYPQLKTDENGEILIEFKLPDSLTRWKFLGLAHTQDLAIGTITKELQAQKDLMVIPNAPRFLREKDTIEFTAKVTNISDKAVSGKVTLELLDAYSGQPLGKLFNPTTLEQKFEAIKGKSALVKWPLKIPASLGAVTYRIIARSDEFADGEEKTLPILTNRMLVTESIPLPVRGQQTKEFQFKKLIESGKSTSLSHHKLTLEFTSNPVWYAVQALPYMMEYPYECTEQTFTRYYANSIARYIVEQNPQIKKVFEIWSKDGNSQALLSNLEKNQELKTLILEETPWLLDAKDESERKKRIALLFDLNRMSSELSRALKKIQDAQLPEGGWSWFKGMQTNRYITQYLVTGFARLGALKIIDLKQDSTIRTMLVKALPYMDYALKRDYDNLLYYKANLKHNHLSYVQIHYLYARSFFQDVPLPKEVQTAFNYYMGQAKKFWLDFNKYSQGMLALTLDRYQDKKTPKKILRSIKEHAIISEEFGMYWKSTSGYYWYQAPIETQALLIEAFSEVTKDKKSVAEMKTWLLKQKQTQDWRTTTATANACYALLLGGENWLAESKAAEITLGSTPVNEQTKPELKREAGTGYFKVSWNPQEIKPEMGKVKVVNPNKNPAWGGLYWQYFEDLDKITPHETPLKLEKKVFIVTNNKKGELLTPITKNNPLKIGDKLKVRIVLKVDRNMEFVHMKDMRASGFEPINVISRYKWQDGLGYYESTKDASTNFFFDYLPKGTYVFEYPLRVTHAGNFSNGITSIQCMYAPEFTSHSEGIRVNVKEQ